MIPAPLQHVRHTIRNLMELLTTWEKNIEKNADEFRNSIFPNYEEIALNLRTQIAKLDKEYQKLTTVVSKAGKNVQMG